MKKSTRSSRMSIPPSVPVVVSIFLMACSQVGTIKSMGIYLEEISSSLGTTPTDIGVALGLFAAFSYFPAPLTTTLYRFQWTRRGIIITGSILISLGVIMTSFATNNILIAVYLGIAGLGHCMLTISSTIALDQIAEGTRFNLLYGVGMSGFGLGMVLLPYVADILGRVYGWRGGLLILGGLMMNIIPCAMTIQTGDSSTVSDVRDYGQSDLESVQAEAVSSEISECTTKIHEEHHAVFCDIPDDGPPDVMEVSGPPEDGCSELTGKEKYCTVPMMDKNIPYGTQKNQSYQKCLDGQSSNLKQGFQDNESSCCVFGKMLARFRKTDFYTDPVLNFMFASEFMFGILYCGWHAFLVPHALQRGYSVQSTIIMTLFASIGNFLGRLLAGVFSYRLTDPLFLDLCAAIINAISILCDVLIQNYYVMAVSACLTAVSIAGMAVLGSLAIRKRASPATFDVAYAICELFFGFGTFIGGYLSGLVGEIFSSYDATFKLLIGANLLVFLFLLPPFIFKKP